MSINEFPGLGLSLTISAIACLIAILSISNFFSILLKCFFINSSKHLSRITSAVLVEIVFFFFP
jgi:hypothetical protein